MSWKEVDKRGDKVLMRDEKGKEKIVPIDKEGIKKGYYLQSSNPKDKDAFIKTYGYHPSETKGDIRKYLARNGLSKKYDPDNPNQGGNK